MNSPTPQSSNSAGNGLTVAMFNANDDTVEMVRLMLSTVGIDCLTGCHFADLRNGNVSFDRFVEKHDPGVVLFDISPPYEENWQFFATLRTGEAMRGRGMVVTTTNKSRLDEAAGMDSGAIQFVGKPYDLQQIQTAITVSLATMCVERPSAVAGSESRDISHIATTALGAVAIFEASGDTVSMIQALLTETGDSQTLISCPFVDLKMGITDFRKYVNQHNPEVVIVDLSPPYAENWDFFTTMRDAAVMQGRGVVLITTSRSELDRVIGEDSYALEVVGNPMDRALILEAIKAATRVARTARRQANDGAGPR